MPGARCTVAVCRNSHMKTKSKVPAISYHSFPKDPQLRKVWVERCYRDGKWNANSCHICSVHFTQNDFEDDIRSRVLGLPERKILKKGAVPSRHLGLQQEQSISVSQRAEKETKFNDKLVENSLRIKIQKDDIGDNKIIEIDPLENVGFDLREKDLEQDNALLTENCNLKSQIEKLKLENKCLKEKFEDHYKIYHSKILKLKRTVNYLKSKKYSNKIIEKKVRDIMAVYAKKHLNLTCQKKKNSVIPK